MPDNHEVNRVQVRIPPFWADDPDLWFAQVESQFQIAGIVTDETKYGHIAGNLEARYAREIRDVLTNPPATGKYDKLKAELIRRLSVSQEQRTRQLLEREELGDKTPSRFLRHLQHLAGTAVPEELLRSLWLGRLPNHMQAILTTQTKATLEDVAELADAITNTAGQTVNEATHTYDDTLKNLVAEIGQLKTQLQQQQEKQNFRRPRRRDQSQSRSQSQDRARSKTREYETCWFHYKFGNEARNCRPTCKHWKQGNDQGSQ